LAEAIPLATVANKPGHRGEHEGNRKTIARGMPDVSGVTVVTNACAFYTTHAAADAPSVRHSLRPLIGGRNEQTKPRAKTSGEIADVYSAVIARSEATKQSILSLLSPRGLLRWRSQ
jgi:hypothetical protein